MSLTVSAVYSIIMNQHHSNATFVFYSTVGKKTKMTHYMFNSTKNIKYRLYKRASAVSVTLCTVLIHY